MIAHDALARLLKKRRKYIIDWLSNGIVRYFCEGDLDGFYPHSFVSLDGDPIFTLIQSYQASDPAKQTTLRECIAGVSALAVPTTAWRRVALLSDANRLTLLSVITSLVSETACAHAVPRLTDSVTTYIALWNEDSRVQAFATVLRCLTDLALSSERHISFDYTAKGSLENCILRLINHENFSPSYAPRCAHALVTLDPESYFRDYRELLGAQITAMHELDQEQEAHAHATAEIMAERAPLQLMKYAPQMQIMGKHAYDAWLFKAWASRDAKFLLFRKGPDPNRVYLARRVGLTGRTTSPIPLVLNNPSFHLFELSGDISAMTESMPARPAIFTQAKFAWDSVLRKTRIRASKPLNAGETSMQ